MLMTRTETGRYRRMLEEKRAELLDHLRNRDQITIEKAPDPMDEVQLAAERDFAIRNLDREAGLLRQVRAAIERIDKEEYGACLSCGEPIGPKRLATVPWTAYCIRCQEAADAGDPGEPAPPFDHVLEAA